MAKRGQSMHAVGSPGSLVRRGRVQVRATVHTARQTSRGTSHATLNRPAPPPRRLRPGAWRVAESAAIGRLATVHGFPQVHRRRPRAETPFATTTEGSGRRLRQANLPSQVLPVPLALPPRRWTRWSARKRARPSRGRRVGARPRQGRYSAGRPAAGGERGSVEAAQSSLSGAAMSSLHSPLASRWTTWR